MLSFLIFSRKCRYCGAPISWRYFSIELLTAIVFTLTIWQFGPTVNGILLCLFMASLIASFFIDLGHFIIPDQLNYFGVTIGMLRAVSSMYPLKQNWLGFPTPFATVSLSASVAGAVLLAGLLWVITKAGTVMFRRQIAEQQQQWDEQGLLEEGEELEAMGLGDVKLAAAMGANLGLVGGFLALFIGVAAGAVVGVGLKASRRLEGHAIPFGPYLIAGTVITLFWGVPLVNWYLRSVGIR